MKAFTIVELLVSIATIAIIVGIILPTMGAARTSARDVACKSNLSQVRSAMIEYEVRTRHWSHDWAELELPEAVQFCPAVRERGYPTYSLWFMDASSPRTFDQQVAAMVDPIMVRDVYAPHRGWSNVARLDSGVHRY